MTSSLPQRIPAASMSPMFEDGDVRRFISARQTDAYVAFQAHHATLLALTDRPEAQLVLDSAPEDDLLQAAWSLEQPRKLVRYWRYALAPADGDAYAQLQEARQMALEDLAAPDDPTRREGQKLLRDVARSFFNNTSDECLAYWIETGEVLGLGL